MKTELEVLREICDQFGEAQIAVREGQGWISLTLKNTRRERMAKLESENHKRRAEDTKA